jgi:hypothetical protein
LDNYPTEELLHESLNKIIELIKKTKQNPMYGKQSFFVFNPSKTQWEEIDVMKELIKKASKKSKKKK